MHLGSPIINKSLRPKDYEFLLKALQEVLAQWTNRKLSYSVQIKLVQWVFYGKFNYPMQGCSIPLKALSKIQSISYNFIQDSQRQVTQKDMILPRMEGGVGLRNLEELHISVAIKRATRAWSHDEIWAQWIQRHYFHNQYIA